MKIGPFPKRGTHIGILSRLSVPTCAGASAACNTSVVRCELIRLLASTILNGTLRECISALNLALKGLGLSNGCEISIS